MKTIRALAIAAVLCVPAALRADTILMTIRTQHQQQLRGWAKYQGRIPALSFQDSLLHNSVGHNFTVSMEWAAALPQLVTTLVNNDQASVKFEFFRPDARGRDSLYYTVDMTDGELQHVAASFDENRPSGVPRSLVTLRFFGSRVAYSTPSGATTAMIVPRVMLGGAKAAMASASGEPSLVTGCMADFVGPPNVPAEVSAGPHTFHAMSFGFSLVARADAFSGRTAGPFRMDSLYATKPSGSATSAIVSASSSNAVFREARIACGDFARGVENLAYAITLTAPNIASMSSSSSGGQPVDRLTMGVRKLTILEIKSGLSGTAAFSPVP